MTAQRGAGNGFPEVPAARWTTLNKARAGAFVPMPFV